MASETIRPGTSTPAQRKALILAARQRGLDLDQLRGLTPGGSLRALSFEQASMMLDRLNAGRPRKSRPGILKMVSAAQRALIASYQGRLGWSDEVIDDFLNRTFGLTRRTLVNGKDASRAIGVMRRILDHKLAKHATE